VVCIFRFPLESHPQKTRVDEGLVDSSSEIIIIRAVLLQ
jgi:hypothetical protein